MTNRKRTKYWEGQWFAVPLDSSGYVLGIVVWGSYKTKYALAYFFGPKLDVVPAEATLDELYASNAILIGWFGNAPLTYGDWPLLQPTPEFDRSTWPIPQFGRIDSFNPNLGWLVTFEQSLSSAGDEERITVPCDVSNIIGLPRDRLYGSEALRITLTLILEQGRMDLAFVTKPMLDK